MSMAQTLDDLDRAAAAAGFAMAAVDDDPDYAVVKAARPSGDAVARGARVPQFREVMAAIPAANSAQRRVDDAGRGLMAGAHTVRETVFGYLGLNASA